MRRRDILSIYSQRLLNLAPETNESLHNYHFIILTHIKFSTHLIRGQEPPLEIFEEEQICKYRIHLIPKCTRLHYGGKLSKSFQPLQSKDCSGVRRLCGLDVKLFPSKMFDLTLPEFFVICGSAILTSTFSKINPFALVHRKNLNEVFRHVEVRTVEMQREVIFFLHKMKHFYTVFVKNSVKNSSLLFKNRIYSKKIGKSASFIKVMNKK